MISFLTYLEQYISLNEDEVSFIRENISVVHYKKNEVIFRAGNVSQTIYFVCEGMVRLFYNVDGNEKTAFFYPEGKFMCAGESYTYGVPAQENYQAIEECKIIHLHKSLIERILKEMPQMELIGQIATEGELIVCQKMIANFVCLSPEERYSDLLQQNGALFLRVPQNYIASYLGVSAETLSRIKKRVQEKTKHDFS